MAIEVVDLPPIMVIFYSYVSLPEGNKGPQLFEPWRFYPTEKKKQDFGIHLTAHSGHLQDIPRHTTHKSIGGASTES